MPWFAALIVACEARHACDLYAASKAARPPGAQSVAPVRHFRRCGFCRCEPSVGQLDARCVSCGAPLEKREVAGGDWRLVASESPEDRARRGRMAEVEALGMVMAVMQQAKFSAMGVMLNPNFTEAEARECYESHAAKMDVKIEEVKKRIEDLLK